MFTILKRDELEPLSISKLNYLKTRIDFLPIYQRYGNIWSLGKKQLLIDTIINSFDIPKFYFNYFTEKNNYLNPKNVSFAVIDGKQRLQAILEFLNDDFELDSEFKYYNNPQLNLAGLNFSQIAKEHSEIYSLIENYILDVVYIVTDEENKLEELFLRLNGGYALTNAEKRNAIGGALNREIRRLAEEHPFFVLKVRFNNQRFQHQDLVTRLLFLESDGDFKSLTNKRLEEFIRINSDFNDNVRSWFENVVAVLDLFCDLFNDDDTLLKNKGVIPIYFMLFKTVQPLPNTFRLFLEQFEHIRTVNRRLKSPDPLLIDYDRRNQQGVHTEGSMRERFEILKRYFAIYSSSGFISSKTRIDSLDIEIEEEE